MDSMVRGLTALMNDFASPSLLFQSQDTVASSPGPIAQLLTDPLAILAVLGGLATVALNFWLFRIAGRHSRPPADDVDGRRLPHGRDMVVFPPLMLQEEGLTIGDVILEIPTDPASLFVYTLLVASVTVVWVANRPRRGR